MNVSGELPTLNRHSTIYFKKKVYIFEYYVLYVYDLRTNRIKNKTKKVKGELMQMGNATSTLVKDRIINTSLYGT